MMMLNDEVNVLRQVPMFSCIDAAKLKKLAFSSHRMRFETGEMLFRQGDDADHAYILITGHAEVLTDGPTGPILIAVIPAGNIVGEIALLCGGSRRATVRAAEPLEVLVIENKCFMRMLSEDSTACTKILRMVAERLAETTADLIAARAELNADVVHYPNGLDAAQCDGGSGAL
ncbi:cyclic nucleotide-binding domain-containing protein [Paracoccus sp. (in: a-proteobacteria)]|uniref:cyclic nucleotide-binding domain-containing protein n=1 Tax=Paracoccus sp. TaxID=267 RepID=UPI0035B10E80